MTDFELDPRLAADSHWIADGPLSHLRLMDDARFRWLVLVPRVAGAIEWIDLDAHSQALLNEEVNGAGRLLRATGACDKLNIGALGNIVAQLHVHVLARVRGDSAWPGPVWGHDVMQRLGAEQREQRLREFRAALPAGFRSD